MITTSLGVINIPNVDYLAETEGGKKPLRGREIWEVKVAQLCPTLWDPMDCGSPGSSVQGILQARIPSGLPFPSPGDLPDPGIESGSPTLQADSLPSEPPGKPYKWWCSAKLIDTESSQWFIEWQAKSFKTAIIMWWVGWLSQTPITICGKVKHNFPCLLQSVKNVFRRIVSSCLQEKIWRGPGHIWAFWVVLMIKNPPANAEDIRDVGSIPVLKSPWRRAWQPTPEPCLVNPMDRGA